MSTPTPADDRSTAPDADAPATAAVDVPVDVADDVPEGDALEQAREAVPGEHDDLEPVGDREADPADVAEGTRQVAVDDELRD